MNAGCRYIKFFLLFLITFAIPINAKIKSMTSLEEEIFRYNWEGKYKISLQKLSDILLSKDLTKEEQANVLWIMATTYRSANDYMTCIDYLEKSDKIAKTLPKKSVVQMKIDYEYAFVYFDLGQYKKSEKAMEYIEAQNYTDVYPEDRAYLLMQKGYLLFLKHSYDEAEKKYIDALHLMENVNPCHVPMVQIKIMHVYSRQKKIEKAEQVYKESINIADKCGILKYKVLATAELEKIYKENNLLNKAYVCGKKVDSLRKLENLDYKVSEMHLIDKAYIEKEQQDLEKSYLQKKIALVFVAIILLAGGMYFYKKLKKSKCDREKIENELEQMKKELKLYSHHFKEENQEADNSFLESDRLTDRQKDLLRLMAEGFSNKEIAEKLFITESTVKYHIRNIYEILELKNRKDFFKKLINN